MLDKIVLGNSSDRNWAERNRLCDSGFDLKARSTDQQESSKMRKHSRNRFGYRLEQPNFLLVRSYYSPSHED